MQMFLLRIFVNNTTSQKKKSRNYTKDIFGSIRTVQYNFIVEKERNRSKQKNIVLRFIKVILYQWSCIKTQGLNDQTSTPIVGTSGQNRLIFKTSCNR